MKQKMFKLAAFALLLAGTMLACGEKGIDTSNINLNKGQVPSENDEILPLQGTQWKLESVVNEQTGEIKKTFEPVECEQCYTLTFDTDSTATGKSVSNEQGFNFNQERFFLGTTKVGEVTDDGCFYYDCMFYAYSYKFENNNVLYFYSEYKDGFILKYKKLLQ